METGWTSPAGWAPAFVSGYWNLKLALSVDAMKTFARVLVKVGETNFLIVTEKSISVDESESVSVRLP